MRVGVVVLVVVAVLAATVGLLWVFQRRLLYFPTQTVPPAASVLPGAEEVTFDTADGLRLRGWFVPARPGGRPAGAPRPGGPAVLVCNGNGGDRSMRAPLVGRLDAPLLVVAGDRDRIVPVGHSRRLFAAAPPPKRLVVLEGADHNDLDLLAGPRLLDELAAFLAGVPGLRG